MTHEKAVRLAETMYELNQWSKSHPLSNRYAHSRGLIKLPPVFLGRKDSDAWVNLVTMIKVAAEYEEGLPNGDSLTLAELPGRFNVHGGMQKLASKDVRKVHNWIQQLSFAMRAAAIEIALHTSTTREEAQEKVYRELYAASKRAFVTHSPDNRHEYKPLRYASESAKKRWIGDEITQRETACCTPYGAKPTPQEWASYALSGQSPRAVIAAITSQIAGLVREAQELDGKGRLTEADVVALRIKALGQNLDDLERWSSVVI